MKREITITMRNPLFWLYIVVVRFRSRIAEIKDKRALARKRKILEIEFKKLNWNDSQIWDMTKFSCGCLDDAVRLLSNRLLEHCRLNDHRLFNDAKQLVISGFDRSWS